MPSNVLLISVLLQSAGIWQIYVHLIVAYFLREVNIFVL